MVCSTYSSRCSGCKMQTDLKIVNELVFEVKHCSLNEIRVNVIRNIKMPKI